MMPSPRVWSRDDFLRAMELGCNGSNNAMAWARIACDVLEFAESSAVLNVNQGRDERGRFLPKPQLHTDSPVVIEARAG